MIIGASFLPRTTGGCSSAWIEASEPESLLLSGFLCLCLVVPAVCRMSECETVGGRICMAGVRGEGEL